MDLNFRGTSFQRFHTTRQNAFAFDRDQGNGFFEGRFDHQAGGFSRSVIATFGNDFDMVVIRSFPGDVAASGRIKVGLRLDPVSPHVAPSGAYDVAASGRYRHFDTFRLAGLRNDLVLSHSFLGHLAAPS